MVTSKEGIDEAERAGKNLSALSGYRMQYRYRIKYPTNEDPLEFNTYSIQTQFLGETLEEYQQRILGEYRFIYGQCASRLKHTVVIEVQAYIESGWEEIEDAI